MRRTKNKTTTRSLRLVRLIHSFVIGAITGLVIFSLIIFSAVSVFDKENLIGYQLKGDVSFVSNKKEKSEIKDGIIRRTSELYKSAYVKNLKEKKDPEVIKFNPKIIYSLNPEEFSDLSVASEADITQLFSRKK